MCDDCTRQANERAARAEAELAQVKRVAAKWMRLALGAPKGGQK